MIDAIECAERLIENEPGLAKDLLDLMIWVNRRDLEDNYHYDKILRNLYSNLDSARETRNAYVKSRAA